MFGNPEIIAWVIKAIWGILGVITILNIKKKSFWTWLIITIISIVIGAIILTQMPEVGEVLQNNPAV